MDERGGDSRPFQCDGGFGESCHQGYLKSDVLNDYEVCRSVRINGRVTLDVYNMELIVPLAYRFDTYFTSLFRKWLVRRTTEPAKERQPVILHLGSSFIC